MSYNEMKIPDFFAIEERVAELGALKSTLPKLNELVPWEDFRMKLESMRRAAGPSKGGRPAFDVVLMFKVLVIGILYNVSDEDLEYQIKDRLSFMSFLGLEIGSRVPDARTIWLFRERLTKAGLAGQLFKAFDSYLGKAGFRARSGQIVDATIVRVPVRRDTPEVNREVKDGGSPESWTESQRRQKDTDARWTRKRGQNYFGYKNHVVVDVRHKLIRNAKVTSAEVFDGNEFEELLRPNTSRKVYGDSAYGSKGHIEKLKGRGFIPRITKAGCRNRALTEEEKAENRLISKVRCRVEHVFGSIRARARDVAIRCIGLTRATAILTMRNLVYNLCRFTVLLKPEKPRSEAVQ